MLRLYLASTTFWLLTPSALRSASLERLAQLRRAGESTHPFFWAAFVANGGWR